MSAGKEIRMSIKCAAILAAWAIPLTACAGQSVGLESANQPVVSGTSASVPGCPNWAGSGESNLGCAVNSNLAAMIADPADLIHGRTYTGTDIEVSTRAVRAWRETAPTGKGGALDKVSAKGGN